MAKKVTKKKTPTKQQLIKDDEYSVVMTAQEMLSVIQIFSFARDIFDQMAVNLVKDGDEKTADVYSARARLSMMLYTKFRDIANIGEPTSREVH